MTFSEFDAFILAVAAMLGGIILLIRGGDWTIDSAVFIAHRYGISPLVVGFTIIAFGTSLPELIVSVIANLQGSPGIAIGNVLGSNIANILLVIGLSATFGTIYATAKGIKRDLIAMLLATVLLAGLLIYGAISLWAGAAMLALLIAYVLYQYKLAVKGDIPLDDPDDPDYKSVGMAFLFLVLGLIAIAIGAEFLVRGAKISASIVGVPEAVIALSIIAFGTSLPELSTCIIAAKKGHSDIAIGNIIGSNVFNILMIIGVTAIVKPIAAGSFAPQLAEFDIWITALVSVIFTAIVFLRGKIDKMTGVLFFASYLVYNIYIYAIYMSG